MSKKIGFMLLMAIIISFTSLLIGVFIGRNWGQSEIRLSQYEKQQEYSLQATSVNNDTPELTEDITDVTEETESSEIDEVTQYTEAPDPEESVTETTTVVKPQTNPDESVGKININTASASDLTLLPGIGPVLGQRIVDYRAENGDYKNINDLINVRGIGEKTLAKISEYITVGG